MIAFAVWIVLLCFAALLGHYVKFVAWIPLLILNGCIGLVAGVMASYAATLLRVTRWMKFQMRIDQLDRLLDFLKQHFPGLFVIVLAFSLATGLVLAGNSCALVDDSTVSVNAVDRAAALDFLKATFLDAARAFGCERLVVVKVGCDVRHAPRVWLTVPPRPPSGTARRPSRNRFRAN